MACSCRRHITATCRHFLSHVCDTTQPPHLELPAPSTWALARHHASQIWTHVRCSAVQVQRLDAAPRRCASRGRRREGPRRRCRGAAGSGQAAAGSNCNGVRSRSAGCCGRCGAAGSIAAASGRSICRSCRASCGDCGVAGRRSPGGGSGSGGGSRTSFARRAGGCAGGAGR